MQLTEVQKADACLNSRCPRKRPHPALPLLRAAALGSSGLSDDDAVGLEAGNDNEVLCYERQDPLVKASSGAHLSLKSGAVIKVCPSVDTNCLQPALRSNQVLSWSLAVQGALQRFVTECRPPC